MKNQLESVNTLLSGGMQNDIPLIIDEWDSTLWQRDPVNDTCYHSAYIAKNIMENFKSVHAMAQAVTSDFSEENQLGQDIFFGGTGLFTSNGLKKSGFYIYQLFSRLGNEQLAAGDNWALFRKGETLQFVLYYFCRYNREKGYHINMVNRNEPYAAFPIYPRMNMQFHINSLPAGLYTIRTWKVGRTGGSVYDKWVEIGRPPILSVQEKGYLEAVSQPKYYTRQMVWDSNSVLCETLEQHDVVLLELDRQK